MWEGCTGVWFGRRTWLALAALVAAVICALAGSAPAAEARAAKWRVCDAVDGPRRAGDALRVRARSVRCAKAERVVRRFVRRTAFRRARLASRSTRCVRRSRRARRGRLALTCRVGRRGRVRARWRGTSRSRRGRGRNRDTATGPGAHEHHTGGGTRTRANAPGPVGPPAHLGHLPPPDHIPAPPPGGATPAPPAVPGTPPPAPAPPPGRATGIGGLDADVCGDDGGTGNVQASFTLTDPYEATGPAPHVVELTNTSSGAVEGCTWTVAGAEDADDVPGPDSDLRRHPVFTFTDPGDYEIRLEVRGPGGPSVATLAISVTDPVSTPDQGPDESGEFVAYCPLSHRANDDPIVYFGQAGASHSHDFFGNDTTDYASTRATLLGGGTTCDPAQDTAAYWVPTLYEDGEPVDIDSPGPGGQSSGTFYYLAQLTRNQDVRAFPTDFRMVAGDATATDPQPTRVIKWGCRADGGETSAEMTLCAGTLSSTQLELYVEFPNCWDGRNRDSANHKTHVAYDTGKQCPPSHPIGIPWLQFKLQYPTLGGHDGVDDPGGPGPAMHLAMDPDTLDPADDPLMWDRSSARTAHGDFLNTWDQAELVRRVENCLNRSVKCNAAGDETS